MTATDQPYTPKGEMFWRPDSNVDAARRLPEWNAFHRACGKRHIGFDHIERDGRRGPYRANCNEWRRTSVGGWVFVSRGEGRGRTVVEALAAAFRASGEDIPEAAAMLERGLLGVAPAPAATAAPQPDNEFDALVEDEFEALL